MAGGARHDDGIRHKATFRRRLAEAQADIARIKKDIKALPIGDPGFVDLNAQLRAARARPSRIRNAKTVA